MSVPYKLKNVPDGVSRWCGFRFHGGYGTIKITGSGCFGCGGIIPASEFQKKTGFVEAKCNRTKFCRENEPIRYFKLDWLSPKEQTEVDEFFISNHPKYQNEILRRIKKEPATIAG